MLGIPNIECLLQSVREKTLDVFYKGIIYLSADNAISD